MEHLKPFAQRNIVRLPNAEINGWHLKRYGLLADKKEIDEETISYALDAALERLPPAGTLKKGGGNHGIGFQIVHFAEVAVVSPIFYWVWGSVLANTHQMRAQWDNTSEFKTGVKEIVGCVWELQIISYESELWTKTILGKNDNIDENLALYLKAGISTTKTNP